jgi:hypothetical protein
LDDGKIYRKPWFLPSNIGLSCKFSHHPILWELFFFGKSEPETMGCFPSTEICFDAKTTGESKKNATNMGSPLVICYGSRPFTSMIRRFWEKRLFSIVEITKGYCSSKGGDFNDKHWIPITWC